MNSDTNSADGPELDSNHGGNENLSELHLQDVDAATIYQLTWRSSSGQVPLPLPAQDREIIDAKQRAMKSRFRSRFRISTFELFLGITFTCVILATSKWLTLPLLAMGLGCATIVSMLGLFDLWLSQRFRRALSGFLLAAYLLVAIAAIYWG